MSNKQDRAKLPGRGGKSKTPQFPADLYILGPRGTTRPEKPETKRPVPSVPTKPVPSTSSSLSDRRKVTTVPSTSGVSVPSSSPPIKKPKLTSTLLPRSEPHSSSAPVSEPLKTWEKYAADIDPSDLASAVLEAKDNNEDSKVVSYLCGAFKILRSNRIKTDNILYNGLLLIAKLHPSLFANEIVVNALCSILRRESTTFMIKSKVNTGNMVLIVNLLYQGFKDVKRWPDTFMKMYIEDSLAERLWVDNEYCKCFTDNIIASVHTRPSSSHESEPGIKSDDIDENLREHLLKDKTPHHVFPRYKSSQNTIESMIIDYVKDQLGRRQTLDGINKNVLKFFACICGISEVRSIIASKLELWLQNPKLMKSAQELLMALCINCTSHTQRDIDVVSAVAKIRLKTKTLCTYYLSCIRELIPANIKNLPIVMKQTVHNELSASRNPNNLPILVTLFQSDPEKCAEILSEIFLELLMTKEDALKPLRILLREITRAVRSDFNVLIFCRTLMSQIELRETDSKDRIFNSITDLITLCVFICIAPYAKTDRRDIQQMERIQKTIAHIQSDAVWWFHETVIPVYRPSISDFNRALHKVAFMESSEHYFKVDNWPPEQDRTIFYRLATEVPLLQSTVLRIMIIGISKDYPLSPQDAFELVEQLVRRAAGLTLPIPVLSADKTEIIDLLFNLSLYHYPEGIDFPAGYVPPQMAVKTLYWKSWIILLIYCAHVPSVFGNLAWETYPMLRMFIEMCITNHFIFPTVGEDLQTEQTEKQEIIQLETYLAKSMITEQTSLLLNQLIILNPTGRPRRPPPEILNELQVLNRTFRLGQLLCLSRNPDFLLDIIHKQGSFQTMPWLIDLVEHSDDNFNNLPVPCLCEFLVSSTEKQRKYQALVSHLQAMLIDTSRDPEVVSEILDYFLRRLSSHSNKDQAISGLGLLLGVIREGDNRRLSQCRTYGEQCSWILNKLPHIPHFPSARLKIVRVLRQACLNENDPDLITPYLTFLSQHTTGANSIDLKEMTRLIMDMAQLIVERSTIIMVVLPYVNTESSKENIALTALLKIFYTYLMKAWECPNDEYVWAENHDYLLVVWSNGKQATFYILVVHAFIVLLTYGSSCLKNASIYNFLLEVWFPSQRQNAPRAYLVNTSEQALMMPDWLKLRMIRSQVPRLVEEALMDLETSQLLLFIQSFGLPVPSMNHLLGVLDHAISTRKIRIEDISVDKYYMIQLIEVQHTRGVTCGKIFSDMLKKSDPELAVTQEQQLQASSNNSLLIDVKEEIPDLTVKIDSSLSPEELEHILDNLHVDVKQGIISKKASIQRQHFMQMLSMELMNNRISSAYPTPILKKVFNKLLRKSNMDVGFVRGLIINYHFPCRLFRLLMTTENKDHINCINLISKTILTYANVIGQSNNLLVTMLSSFTQKTGSHLDPIHDQLKSQSAKPENLLEALKDSSIDRIAKASSKFLESGNISTRGNKTLVESIARIMKSDDSINKTGLFIDLLVQIEPEIIGSSLNLQLEILFSRDKKWKWIYKCRPYLLTLLIHHASWSTLEKAVVSLLTLESTTKYDPTSVLDFLWAVACSPKFWQGREKIAPKHQSPRDMLRLTDEQLVSVTEYIILEVELNGCHEDMLNTINNRISDLIEHSVVRTDRTAKFVCKHVENNLLSKRTGTTDAWEYFLIQVYLRVPGLKKFFNDELLCRLFKTFNIAGSFSLLDSMSHSVLTSITSQVQRPEWKHRSANLELIIRKMASTHPFLVLRQLEIIQTSLSGRTHLEWNVFRIRNYCSLFVLVLEILELLIPHLFVSQFTKPLHVIFNCYFELFKNYRSQSETRAMLEKFIPLLESYINHNTVQAVTFFQSQTENFKILQESYPSLRGLFVMISDKQDTEHRGGIVITSTISNNEPSEAEYNIVINSLKYNEPGMALQELDRCSLSKPVLIEPVIEQMFPLLTHHTVYIRQMTHMLLVRCIKHNPLAAKRILAGILNCLETNNSDFVESATESIPELVVCCQENAVPILSKLFSLNITHNMNTLPCINKTVSLLKLQMNC